MIGLIVGTSEGKVILSHLNKHTDNIVVSTATTYGGELLNNYRYKVLNDKPLAYLELKALFENNGVNVLVDASHPYAVEISAIAMRIAKELNIEYLRYERKSTLDTFPKNDLIVEVPNYEDLGEILGSVDGCILNTTGSRNIGKILDLNVENRIVHRVLPSLKVMEEVFDLGVKVEDLIFIKGPISYELNKAFIKEYNGKALLTKDSGPQGGTYEKIKAAIDLGIKVIVVERKIMEYGEVFNNEDELCDYICSNKQYLS
ncbi:MAG: cobalt-precorrin-6A reductase [Clostridium sp.]|uniref:cobalt-precorrin-6A reductase n=1 Tax=Clostridium sp. TaxID=1506 RepID=UPI0030679A09